MKKTYCLYLDEGGDFDKDLESDWKNECLVGGYLVEKSKRFAHTESRRIIADAYRAVYPQESGISDQEAFDNIAHANELKVEKKAEICYHILTNMNHKVEFVIFENYKKAKLVSSSRTYLNILVDGIMQLFFKLISQNHGDTVCLEVMAGYRKNTSGEDDLLTEGSDIAVREYEKRINERLLLEKIKRQTIFASRHEITFQCGRDKKNHFLVPCDYICNFYITRTAKVFSEKCKDEMSYKEYLLKLYKEEYIFHLNGNAEQERLLYYMDSQTYDAALFDICTGMIQGESAQKSILDNIKMLSEKQVRNILSGLSTYMNNVVEIERNTTSSLEYLKKAKKIIQELSDEGYRVGQYRLDINLYELAVYDHIGDLDKMQELFEECVEDLQSIVMHAENIEYIFMFLNRNAVYLYDIFEFEKGYELLEKLKKCFEAYELIFGEIPQLEVPAEKIHSIQLGKILGTQVQYCRHMMRQGKMKYEDVVKTSDWAIENFELEADRGRQYQYRTQVEAEAGHYDMAMAYFKKGWKVDKWEDIFQQEKINPFAMYHLSFLMQRFAENEAYEKEIRSMLKKFRDNEEKVFSYIEFPGFFVCANIAKTMICLKMDDMAVQKYYRQALLKESDRDTKPLFLVFLLMIHADYVGWMLENGKNVEKELKAMKVLLESVLEKIQTESIKSICRQLSDILTRCDAKEYFEFGRLLPY